MNGKPAPLLEINEQNAQAKGPKSQILYATPLGNNNYTTTSRHQSPVMECDTKPDGSIQKIVNSIVL